MAKSKITAAIDIGSSKITTLLAQTREDDPSKIHIVGASSLPSKGVRKGQINNIEDVVACIVDSVEAAERMAGFNVAKAWVSIGGSHIGSLNSKGVVAIAQPHGEVVPEDISRVVEAARAVSLPVSSEIIHIVPRSFTVDGQEGIKDPAGMSGVRLEVDTHIITGASIAVKNLNKCVSEVGCDVAGVVFNGLASGEAVLTDTEKELGAIMVDIGGGSTAIAIYVEGALSYSSVLPIGAKNVTNDLAIGLRISLESAEKIKLFLGSSKLKDKEDELDLSPLSLPEDIKSISYKTLVEGIIRPRLNEMFQMIASEIKKSGLVGLTPSGLIVCGGGSLTVGLSDSAKRILSMPTRIGYPVGISGLVDDIESPAFASAVGLLHYAVKENETYSPRQSGFSGLPSFDNVFSRLPGKGSLGKIGDLIKSLLP